MTLSHLDHEGRASMVSVGGKPRSERVAVARGRILMAPATLERITTGSAAKGDVLAVARIAGIQAAKLAGYLIPLCHPLALTHVAVDLAPDQGQSAVVATATVRALDRTGVEMEALMAVTVSLLTVYDMLKAVDRAMVLEEVQLLEKRGGASGDWTRGDSPR